MPGEDSEKLYTCGSCGIVNSKVEAGGIYYCPNALCQGCGGAWFRATLDSFVENDDQTHCVDEEEWLVKGIKYNKSYKIDRNEFIRVRSQ